MKGQGSPARASSVDRSHAQLRHRSFVPFRALEAAPLEEADQLEKRAAGGARRAGPGGGHVAVNLRWFTRGAGSHGGKRAAQRRRLPSAPSQRLGPLGGGYPQRLEELLAVGGQGADGAERLP